MCDTEADTGSLTPVCTECHTQSPPRLVTISALQLCSEPHVHTRMYVLADKHAHRCVVGFHFTHITGRGHLRHHAPPLSICSWETECDFPPLGCSGVRGTLNIPWGGGGWDRTDRRPRDSPLGLEDLLGPEELVQGNQVWGCEWTRSPRRITHEGDCCRLYLNLGALDRSWGQGGGVGRAQSWGRGPVPCDSSVGGLRCEACPCSPAGR